MKKKEGGEVGERMSSWDQHPQLHSPASFLRSGVGLRPPPLDPAPLLRSVLWPRPPQHGQPPAPLIRFWATPIAGVGHLCLLWTYLWKLDLRGLHHVVHREKPKSHLQPHKWGRHLHQRGHSFGPSDAGAGQRLSDQVSVRKIQGESESNVDRATREHDCRLPLQGKVLHN